MQVVHCGRMDYAAALETQERLAAAVAAGTAPETLLLLEHPAVYTIGRGGDAAHLLDPLTDLRRVNRGGDITWHGPGQLVGYPIVLLGRRGLTCTSGCDCSRNCSSAPWPSSPCRPSAGPG